MKTIVRKISNYKSLKDLFPYYQREKNTIFLDSSMENEYGRFSVLGIKPSLILEEKNNIFTINGIQYGMNIEDYLSDSIEKNKETNPTHLPLITGFLGYFSYDYSRKFEKIQTRHPSTYSIPEAIFILYKILIIEDLEKKELYITSIAGEDLLDRVEKEISQIEIDPSIPSENNEYAEFSSFHAKDEYLKAIQKTKDYIEEGDIYILNLTHQIEISSKKDPYKVYHYLRNYNPAPFSSFMKFEDFEILCSSPERFIQIKDGMIETRPIKGTRKRGKTAEEDFLMKKELEDSEKDRSELLMIVDLERNDLNHICDPGSVQVPELFTIEAYSTVFHLVSTIVGKISKDIRLSTILSSTFPGGSITGAPKIRAMEIIDELEESRRGIYTGSIGYFSFDGNCDLNIVIRTLVHASDKYYLGVGGGITYESDLDFEYEETIQKAKALLLATKE